MQAVEAPHPSSKNTYCKSYAKFFAATHFKFVWLKIRKDV